jgi:tartrate/fumarate subfamily iron-sulfur-dependent hydro-lyase beta chain
VNGSGSVRARALGLGLGLVHGRDTHEEIASPRSRAQERSVPVDLAFPAEEPAIRALHAGDEVLVSGTLFTAREPAHRKLVRGGGPVLASWTRGAALYHCGPVVVREAATGAWRLAAAGPSESMPLEPWTAQVLERYGIRAVIGRGGMGPGTRDALARFGAVYLHATGALAVALARHVIRVASVHLLDELGPVEALWRLEVRGFPATVTMDAHGVSLHARRAGDEEPDPERIP